MCYLGITSVSEVCVLSAFWVFLVGRSSSGSPSFCYSSDSPSLSRVLFSDYIGDWSSYKRLVSRPLWYLS